MIMIRGMDVRHERERREGEEKGKLNQLLDFKNFLISNKFQMAPKAAAKKTAPKAAAPAPAPAPVAAPAPVSILQRFFRPSFFPGRSPYLVGLSLVAKLTPTS